MHLKLPKPNWLMTQPTTHHRLGVTTERNKKYFPEGLNDAKDKIKVFSRWLLVSFTVDWNIKLSCLLNPCFAGLCQRIKWPTWETRVWENSPHLFFISIRDYSEEKIERFFLCRIQMETKYLFFNPQKTIAQNKK